MVHLFNPDRMESLLSERRQQAVRPRALLQRAGLQAGATVLDWGCGAGFFALPAAQLVGPSGLVIGVDLQPEMVAATQEAASRAGLTNLRVILAPGPYDLPPDLPAVDWVLLAYILHEVDAPERLLQLAQRTLKPQGRLLVVEWPKEAGPHGPPLAERLSPAELAPFYQPWGWQVQDFWESRPEYYALVLVIGGVGG
uniref:class I SAM-dependent methyltransferase n=1 Tax=Desulfobacca sp. TaxID=2067990 RepID=UPI00404A6165